MAILNEEFVKNLRSVVPWPDEPVTIDGIKTTKHNWAIDNLIETCLELYKELEGRQ